MCIEKEIDSPIVRVQAQAMERMYVCIGYSRMTLTDENREWRIKKFHVSVPTDQMLSK